MKKLELGDELVDISSNYHNRIIKYNFKKVVRLTAKQAVLDDNTKVVNEPIIYNKKINFGIIGGGWLELATEEHRNLAARESKLDKAESQYWKTFGHSQPSREVKELLMNIIQNEENHHIISELGLDLNQLLKSIQPK